MFIDKTKIYVKAGNGGDGAVAFHREKYVAAGGPDGGDGGKGGDVVLEVDPNLNTLTELGLRGKFIAKNGENGKGSKMFGKSSEDLVIKVPLGTLVRDAETGRIIKDMSDSNPFIIAKGGKGGWGNRHFATPTRQCPRFAKPGIDGEQRDLILELKLIADVGLIGFPNVGKSTLLSVLSSARPKIANYHFTTLVPSLGVVNVGEGHSFVMADIPGIIEGASDGVGLGHDFLRHVERCRLLVHIVDISGSEGRDPIEDYKIINRELSSFSEKLSKCLQIVVGNKIDSISDESIPESFRNFIKTQNVKYFEISAAAHINTDDLKNNLYSIVSELPPVTVYESDPEVFEFNNTSVLREIEIHKYGDNVYEVEGDWLRSIMRTIDYTDSESMQYFQRVLRITGVIDKLVQAGVKEGDTVSLYNFDFDFVL